LLEGEAFKKHCIDQKEMFYLKGKFVWLKPFLGLLKYTG